jgi:Ca2+-binding EF-hand superfamily protein
MKYYDADQDGNISPSELSQFVNDLREPMNSRRNLMVTKVYNYLDQELTGKITVAAVQDRYDVTYHPEFKKGNKTRDQLVNYFLSKFESASSGAISREDFYNYYTDVSMTVAIDDDFIDLLQTSWCVAEDDNSKVFLDNLKALTAALRLKLRTFANGSLEEFVLRNLFKEFDTNKSGALSMDEFMGMLRKLQISVDQKYGAALFKKFDDNNNHLIEFDEFCNWVIYDPYK